MNKIFIFLWVVPLYAKLALVAPAERIAFSAGSLTRLGIQGRLVVQVVGMPDHVVWKLEEGYVFFDSTLGCSFCLFDNYHVPYDVVATPNGQDVSVILLEQGACKVEDRDIQKFLAMPSKKRFCHIWSDFKLGAFSLKKALKYHEHCVVIAEQSALNKEGLTTYYAVPVSELKALVQPFI